MKLESLRRYIVVLTPFSLVAIALGGWRSIIGFMILVFYVSFFVIPQLVSVKNVRILKKRELFLLSTYLLLFFAYSRSFLSGHFSLVSYLGLLAFWMILFIGMLEWPKQGINSRTVFFGVITYVLINVFGAFLGVPSPENAYQDAGSAKILELLGFSFDRKLFPFALGVNGFGVLAGLATSICLSLVIFRASLLNFLIAVLCIFALLMSDSRGAIAVSFVIFVLLILFRIYSPTRTLRNVFFLGVSISFFILTPVLFVVVEDLFGELATLARAGGGILSGREVIWAAVFDSVSKMPLVNLLFGFGHFGQIDSGASLEYSSLFWHLSIAQPEKMNVHSAALQLFLDFGLVGVAYFSFLIFYALKKSFFEEPGRGVKRPMQFSTVLYCVLAGTTDLTINQNNLVVFFVFTAVIFFSISADDLSSKRFGAYQ